MTTSYVIDPAPPAFLPVAGTRSVFPVRRVFCVAQNYRDHAIEMGATPDKIAAPAFFMKTPDSIVHDGAMIPYPPQTADLHHEIELVVALKSGGRDIAADDAAGHIFGYTSGVDLTRRDLQSAAKTSGKPWDMGKNFDAACPCGILVPAGDIAVPDKGKIQLSVNGQLRQNGNLADMMVKPNMLISILSRYITLAAGDIIMTGTPAGVGPVVAGDKIDAHIENIGDLSFTIRDARS